jgi:hypothetical protein
MNAEFFNVLIVTGLQHVIDSSTFYAVQRLTQNFGGYFTAQFASHSTTDVCTVVVRESFELIFIVCRSCTRNYEKAYKGCNVQVHGSQHSEAAVAAT